MKKLHIIIPSVAVLTVFGLGLAYNVSNSTAKKGSVQVMNDGPTEAEAKLEALKTVAPSTNETDSNTLPSNTPSAAQATDQSGNPVSPAPTVSPSVDPTPASGPAGEPIGTVHEVPGTNGGITTIVAP